MIRTHAPNYDIFRISKSQDSGFHKQNVGAFQIPQAKMSLIPESEFPYIGRQTVLKLQLPYLSSYTVVMPVHCCPSVDSSFQFVEK